MEGVDAVSYVAKQRFNGDVKDLNYAKAVARPYILVLDYFDITNPALDKFNPKSTLTRGQFASFLHRISNEKIGDIIAPKVAITDFKATGSNTLTVTFNKEVELKNAKFSVYKGNSNVSISNVELAKDKKSAKLFMSSKLTAGNYTLTLSGVADSVFTKTAAVENEKASSIEFLTDYATPNSTANKVRIPYKVVNQYGENITSAVQNVVASSNVSGAGSGTTVNYLEGIVEITKATKASNFRTGDKISLTITDRTTSISKSKVVTVADKSKVSEVKITNLYTPYNQSASLNVDSTYENFYLVLTAKDQYGLEVSPQDIANDVVVAVSDTSVIDINRSVSSPNFSQLTIDGKSQTVLQLKEPRNKKRGKAVFQLRQSQQGKRRSTK